MDCSDFKYPFNYFSIFKATFLRLVWADFILNSTSPIPLAFKNIFIKSKVDKTLIRETYAISAVFTANSLVTIELINKFPASHPIYFLIDDRQDLAITNSLNPKSSIDEITLENI